MTVHQKEQKIGLRNGLTTQNLARTQQEVCKVVRVNYAQNMIDAGLSVHFYCIKLIILIIGIKKRVITFGGLFSFY